MFGGIDPESLRFVYLRRVVATVLGALGPRRAVGIATALARNVCDLNPPGKLVARERLRTALGADASDARVEAIVQALYEHIGRFWAEALFLHRRLRPSSWRHFVAVSQETPLADIRRCVVATCYFGNPAVGAFIAGRLFGRAHVVVDLLPDPAARAWQDQLYRLPGLRPIPIDESADRLPDVMQQPGALVIVAEHRRARGGGVEARFLGEPGRFQPTPGRLAAWYDVPVVPMICRRRPGVFAFETWFGIPVRGHDIHDVTRAVLNQLDVAVRRWPEQYLWNIAPKKETPGGLAEGSVD